MTSDSRNWTALKGVALTSTFAIAAAQTTLSTLFVPSLLRPLDSSRSSLASPAPSRPSSSLNVPRVNSIPNDGRLTPQPSESKTFNFTLGQSGTYKAVAQQFVEANKLFRGAVVPLEVLAIAIFGTAAYRARSAGSGVWTYWLGAAGLVASVFPVTGIMMTPLVHKVMRISGDEEKVEPYEDAPIDREAEKSNTIEFVSDWAYINVGRSLLMYAAVGVGALAFYTQ